MHFLKAIAMMAPLAIISWTAMTAASPAPPPSSSPTPKPIAKPPKQQLISTLNKKFTLAVLAPDSKGKINLKVSDPVILNQYGLFSDQYVSLPLVGLANLAPTVFSLKNKKLRAEGSEGSSEASEATLLPDQYEISLLGLRSFVFFPDVGTKPVNFTAVQASDSYGRTFLRLGRDDGEFFSFSLP